MKQVYFDNAATTCVSHSVAEAMRPWIFGLCGNPSSLHQFGRKARAAVEAAREHVSLLIGAKPNEIYFTSGGTESDNWAIRGAAMANAGRGKHIITSNIEHHAVLRTFRQLEKEGFDVTYLQADSDGLISTENLSGALRSDTTLVSIMHANNEIGAIEPIEDLSRVAHNAGAIFHTDAVQTTGYGMVDVNRLDVDLLSMSAHKFHGPKGTGALYIRDGVSICNLIHGGSQERDMRPGTENIPGIVGMGAAAQSVIADCNQNWGQMESVRAFIVGQLFSRITGVHINSGAHRLPGIISARFDGVDAQSLLMMLDHSGIAVSAGSACNSKSLYPSHVLKAIGLSDVEAYGTIRISLSGENTIEEAEYVAQCITESVGILRSMSNKIE